MNTDKYIYRKALRRVKRKKGFYYHLAAYIAVGVFFFLLNMFTDPFDIWFPFPMMPWGLGLFFHYLGVFGLPGMKLDKEWEEREVEREMHRMNGYSAPNPGRPIIDDELELKEFKELRQEWNDQEFV